MGRQWMVAVSAGRYQAQRLYQHDQVELPVPGGHPMAVGDEVVLVASAEPPVVFGLARVLAAPRTAERVPDDPDDMPDADAPVSALVGYRRRLIDRPVPVADAGCAAAAEDAAAGPVVLDPADYRRLVATLDAVAPVAPRREWMVSLDLPVEASSAAEAVRVFWTYVRTLGPRELPAFVWPRGDELAMRPYVLGAEHEMDPEEDEG